MSDGTTHWAGLTEEDRKNNETLDDFLQKFDKAIELQKETQRRFDSNEKEVADLREKLTASMQEADSPNTTIGWFRKKDQAYRYWLLETFGKRTAAAIRKLLKEEGK